MDRDYFIKLVFGTHKVADLLAREGKDGNARLSGGQALKTTANKLLADLLLICDENPVTLEQKKNVLPRTLRAGSEVLALLLRAKQENENKPFDSLRSLRVNPQNFEILEQEYRKLPDMLVAYFAAQKTEAEPQESKTKSDLGAPKSDLGAVSARQQKILEYLKTKEKAQVWELQKMLPEPVTKRTLRRDMDYLLQLGRVEREGEWNGVFYRLASI